MTKDVAIAVDRIRNWARMAGDDDRFTIRFEEFPVPPESELSDYEEVIAEEIGLDHYKIPHELREVYAHTGGIDLQWTCLTEGRTIAGTCRVVGLMELYQRDEEAETPMRDCIRVARPFDIVSEDEMVALCLGKDARLIRKMVLIDEQAPETRKLSHTPASYIVEAAEWFGLYGWQRGTSSAADLKILQSILANSP